MDRLGDRQYQWLEDVLAANMDSNLTLIIAGVNIQPDNAYPFQERFEWQDKKRMYDIVRRTRKSGVVFVTGDVHYGLMVESPCKAVTGGYIIPEVISSGMTHTDAEYIPFMDQYQHFLLQPIYSKDKPFGHLNYGYLTITPQGNSGLVTLHVKDYDGNDVFYRAIDTKKDLIYTEKFNDMNAELCTNLHTKHVWWLQLLAKLMVAVKYNTEEGWWVLDSRFYELRRSLAANFTFMLVLAVGAFTILKAMTVIIWLIKYVYRLVAKRE